MKQIDYSSFSLEELKKKEKDQKTAIGIFIGTVVVMIIAAIIITVQRGLGFFSIMPAMFLPIMFINLSNLKKIKKEIELKEQAV